MTLDDVDLQKLPRVAGVDMWLARWEALRGALGLGEPAESTWGGLRVRAAAVGLRMHFKRKCFKRRGIHQENISIV